jgi:hypothetical protein
MPYRVAGCGTLALALEYVHEPEPMREEHIRWMSLLLLGCFEDIKPELRLLDASALSTPLGLLPPRDGPCTDFCFGAMTLIARK